MPVGGVRSGLTCAAQGGVDAPNAVVGKAVAPLLLDLKRGKREAPIPPALSPKHRFCSMCSQLEKAAEAVPVLHSFAWCVLARKSHLQKMNVFCQGAVDFLGMTSRIGSGNLPAAKDGQKRAAFQNQVFF